MKKIAKLSKPFIHLLTGTILISNTAYATSDNRLEVENTILTVCPAGIAEAGFQTRCNALVGAGQSTETGLSLPTDILTQITSEQTAAQKSVALEMNSAQFNTISNRMTAVRHGQQSGGLKISGLLYDSNGHQISGAQLNKLSDGFNKAAAGDDTFDRLGIFVNANIGFGDRVTTSNESGYNLDKHGTTIGMDYRITDNFLLGTAFSYNNATSRYANNLGKLEADNYSGAIYASFFTEKGLFIDGVFSGSHLDYDSTRHIEYSVPGDTVNINATGENSGYAFNVAMTAGFNFNYDGLLVTPLIRVDYTTNDVDSLDEQGGQGWELHIDSQDFDSLQTAAGLQLAYAISFPWGVISPMVQAEYIHEFKNDARNLRAHYLQDPSKTRFNIGTDRPDRDYITLTAGIAAQFTHGISAFVSYDTVQAHSYVTNHNFTGGLRIELPF
jgi:outer membrane autotransporter protein